MAITKCVECRKPISDKALVCSHCGYTQKGASDDDLLRSKKIKRLKMMSRFQGIIYVSMIIFLAGILLFYFGKNSGNQAYLMFGYTGLLIGGLGYLYGRIKFIVYKKEGC